MPESIVNGKAPLFIDFLSLLREIKKDTFGDSRRRSARIDREQLSQPVPMLP